MKDVRGETWRLLEEGEGFCFDAVNYTVDERIEAKRPYWGFDVKIHTPPGPPVSWIDDYTNCVWARPISSQLPYPHRFSVFPYVFPSCFSSSPLPLQSVLLPRGVAMNTVKYFSETYDVTIHGSQKIEAVYTNNPAELERVLDMYQEWFAAGDPKIMGLDMEYTSDRALKDKRMAVIQIAMRRHVLIFQYSRYEQNV